MYNRTWKFRNICGRFRLKGAIEQMKRITVFCLMLCLMTALFPAASLADDAGVLSESELGAWVTQVLRDTIGKEPLNAPVGEESRTENGYAFLYDFATLYYDKPQLDEQSVLGAISVTGEAYAAPRDIVLGTDEDTLLATFGWQNPYLMGDGAFASFYCVDELPTAAYWCWGQHDEDWKLLSMQCAVHVQTAQDTYTDAMLHFELENGTVTAIRAEGLSRLITGAAVNTNLEVVRAVEAAAGLDAMGSEHADGYAVRHEAAAFGAEDLAFGTLDYRTMDATTLETALGQQLQSSETHDGRMTARWENAYLTMTDKGAVVLGVSTDALAGPRGIRVGDELENVLALFYSDGEGRTEGSFALLYGQGDTLPNATMEQDEGMTMLNYSAALDTQSVTLSLSFAAGKLQEWVLYSW